MCAAHRSPLPRCSWIIGEGRNRQRNAPRTEVYKILHDIKRYDEEREPKSYNSETSSPVIDGFGVVGVVVAPPPTHNWAVVDEVIAGHEVVADGAEGDTEITSKQGTI